MDLSKGVFMTPLGYADGTGRFRGCIYGDINGGEFKILSSNDDYLSPCLLM